MTNKYEAHVPIEQYGFISVTTEGTAEHAIEAYREVASLARAQSATSDNLLPRYGAGMEKKKYDEIIDLMIERKPIQMDPGELDEMNSIQRYGFDTVRKSLNRTKDN